MRFMRFQIWKSTDGSEWTCAEEGKCLPYNDKGEHVDVDGDPMTLMWEFDVDLDDFDGNVDHARRAANVAQYTYHAAHFRWPVERRRSTLNGRRRALEKQASRDEDARRLAAGEVTREELAKENGSFAFPADRVVIHHPKKEK